MIHAHVIAIERFAPEPVTAKNIKHWRTQHGVVHRTPHDGVRTTLAAWIRPETSTHRVPVTTENDAWDTVAKSERQRLDSLRPYRRNRAHPPLHAHLARYLTLRAELTPETLAHAFETLLPTVPEPLPAPWRVSTIWQIHAESFTDARGRRLAPYPELCGLGSVHATVSYPRMMLCETRIVAPTGSCTGDNPREEDRLLARAERQGSWREGDTGDYDIVSLYRVGKYAEAAYFPYRQAG